MRSYYEVLSKSTLSRLLLQITFIVAKYCIPSAIIHAKDKWSFAVSLDAGFFSPVL